jgi:hypothetical protein
MADAARCVRPRLRRRLLGRRPAAAARPAAGARPERDRRPAPVLAGDSVLAGRAAGVRRSARSGPARLARPGLAQPLCGAAAGEAGAGRGAARACRLEPVPADRRHHGDCAGRSRPRRPSCS